MAKLFKSVKHFFFNIWYFRRNLKFRSINKKLKSEVLDQEKERRIFLQEFRVFLRKYLRKDASGKYIPLSGKNRAEIYEAVMAAHGPRMRELNIGFTKKLQIKL